jgi:hypothetical protein
MPKPKFHLDIELEGVGDHVSWMVFDPIGGSEKGDIAPDLATAFEDIIDYLNTIHGAGI